MEDFLPYRAEYAKTDRSTCKGCRTKILKATLRLAAVVQSPTFDGSIPHWYHYVCFFAKQKPKAVGDIEKFESLKWEDQEKIREKVSSIWGGATNGSANAEEEKPKKKGAKRAAGGSKKAGSSKNNFQCDLAKSNRSTCRGCLESILKGELRIAKVDFESDEGRRYGGVPLWHHAECFIKLRGDLGFWDSGTTLNGYTELNAEGQETVKTGLPEMKPVKTESDDINGVSAPKKTKSEPIDSKKKKALIKQTENIVNYTNFLNKLKRPQISEIMEENDEPVLKVASNVERIADAMAFGWPVNCEKCKSGKLKFKSVVGAYKCRGNVTEWVQCDNVVLEPKRRPFVIPESLEDEFAEIGFKPKMGRRIIVSEERSVVLNPTPSTSADGMPKVKSERLLPLKNMEFVIIGKDIKKDVLKKEITKMGGKVGTKIHSKLAAVISNKEEVEKMSKRMKDVEEANIQVVPESFVQESLAGNTIENITRLNLANWGSDAKKRLAGIESLKSGILAKSNFAKSGKSSKMTLKIKGGSAVDPESGLEDRAHVYVQGKDVYSAVLSLTDVIKGRNKFYRIQILEADNKTNFWVFRAWGRIGTTIGGTKLEQLNLKEAIKLFKFKYEEETGNMWENRHNFTKVPHRMIPMDIDLGSDEVDGVGLNMESDLQSNLPKPVQELIAMIFNVDIMKKVMLEFEIDLQKMPLGKISKKQIQTACSILSELQKAIDEDKKDRTIVLDATNRFYTLIPHDFGINQPPILNNLEIIKNKMEMLDSLLEMEIAYGMMKSAGGHDSSQHPVDAHYDKLGAHIEPLPRNTPEYEILEKYVKNTHAATHSMYTLTVEEIFTVKRPVEEKRFKPFRKLHNRKLLWHGSRLTNFAGILSQGLRIAPPEAPSTGYMFGKGVYFADMVSKSANYCMASHTNNTALMLLCEVALGDTHERTHAEYIERLPAGKHSCHGVGATWPDPEEKHVLDDGVEVPFGKPVKKFENHQTSLLYNEYIVYDVAQVKARYLFRMKFDYKF